MSKEEAIEQLYRLSLDWEENGLDTKLNQTDINAIGIVISELDIANEKLEDIKEYTDKKLNENSLQKYPYRTLDCKYILSIIGGNDEK